MIREPFGLGAGQSLNVGTVGSYGTVAEYGDGTFHKTVISLSGALPAIAGGANLAVGRLIYTFPAGNIRVVSSCLKGVALKQTTGKITADTPVVGLGTVIGSGAVAVLSGTSTFVDILAGQALADCNGTGKIAAAAQTLTILSTAAHTVHLNVADGWAADGDPAAIMSGDVIITWEFLG